MKKLNHYMKLAVYLAVNIGFSSAMAQTDDAVFTAIKRDNRSAMSSALVQGSNPNARDDKGQLALLLALQLESLNAAEGLFDSPGLDVNAPNQAGETALMMAALKGQRAWCERLLARGAAVNREGWTPLHYAASGPDASIVPLLLDRGADINAPSPNGSTPLMMAAGYGAEASLDALLARGADPRKVNERGLNVVDFAKLSGRESLVKRLLSMPALVQAR
ncbi:MAG: hypothetical protein RJA98_1050 [Pseudomonadota bacterium]